MAGCGRRYPLAFCLALSFAGGGCGWFEQNPPGGYAETQKRITDAREELKRQGAGIEDKEFPMNQVALAVDLSGQTITEETLDLLPRLNGVGELNLSGSTISDEQMRRIGELSPVWALDLSDTSVSDQGLSHLKQNTIRELNVTGTKVTDEAVAALEKRYKEDPNIHPFFRSIKVTR